MIKIPTQSKKLRQNNRSNILGEIWASFNLDLTSNIGKVRISPRGMLTTSSASETDLRVATAFKTLGTSGDSNYGIYACAGTKIYKNSGVIYGNFTPDSTTNTPTLSTSFDQDMIIFGTKLYVSGLASGDLAFLDTNGNWSSTVANGIYGPMTVFGNRLYYAQNLSTVGSTIDGSTLLAPSGNPNTVPYTLGLGNYGGSSANAISCMRASSNRIWIGVINKAGGKARIYEWDGSDVVPTRFYTLESSGVLAMAIMNDVPWIVDADGRLLAYNGGSFQEKARLPITGRYLNNPFDADAYDRFIHFNGISVQEDRMQLLVNNLVVGAGTNLEENIPAGIWEYSEETGLYHKQSLSTWVYQTTTTPTDYAFNRVYAVGALSSFKSTSNAANYNGSLICGAGYYTNATATAYGIFIDDTNDTTPKVGYWVTPQIHSQSKRDVWQSISVIHQALKNATDRFIVKYRTDHVDPTLVTGTWTTTTTFTTSTSVLGMEGQEVEILSGFGAGMCAHITKIDWDNSVYTVTIDETLTGATGTSLIRISDWNKIDSSGADLTNHDYDIKKPSRWIQFKIFFIGANENEIDELQINNAKST